MNNLIWYFAYGSNMKESRLKKRKVRIFDHHVGYIVDFSFCYNKIGADNSAKGNIIPQQGDIVWGVFFKIPEEDYLHLHKTYEIGYQQFEIEGITNHHQTIPAKSFYALPENTDNKMSPNKKYYEIVLEGAREKKLPEKYIRSLKDLR